LGKIVSSGGDDLTNEAKRAESAPSLDEATLRGRARLGVVLLAGRTVLQQLTILVGNVYLARLLGPREFGAFWIIQFALTFFTLFGDAGLGAALIQKKEAATQEELSSVFWFQVGIGITVALIVSAAAPWVVTFWADLPEGAPSMLRALSLELLLTSLRVIPVILLERELLFGRLATLDLVLTFAFYGSAVGLAHLGYGPFALVAAALVQGAAGIVAAYSFRPWLPSLQCNTTILRPVIKFGAVFQAKHVIGFINGAVMPLYAGRALGSFSLGIVTWSQNTAFFPLRIVDILGRVNFPLLSRLQHDRRAFAQSFERTIQVCATITLLFVALVLGLGPAVVEVIYGDKWVPALPTFYVFAVAISVGFLVPIINGALDAIGQPRIMMRLGMYWAGINWAAVTTVMHFRSDPLAFSIAYCVHILFGNLAAVFAVKKVLPDAHVWPRIRAAGASAVVTAVVGRTLLLPLSRGPVTLSLAILGITAAFAGMVALLDKTVLVELRVMMRGQRSAESA
jgi:PST family polysaccharide transporter